MTRHIFVAAVVFCGFVFLCLIMFVSPLKKFIIFKRQITYDLFVKQRPFQKEYYLTDTTGKILLNDIQEWMITENYVYGCCGLSSGGKGYGWYIFNRKNGECLFYDAEPDFTAACRKLLLPAYCMDSFNTPEDFIWGMNPDKFPLGKLE